MPNLNKVFLIGRLTRDPELRYTQAGTAYALFGLATDREWGKGEERKKEVLFVDLVAWGKQAQLIQQYLAKGREVFVEGRLKLDSWETEGGEKRSKISVVVEAFQFVGGKPKDEGAPESKKENLEDMESPF